MRVAEAVAQTIPRTALARIWVFTPLRRDDREWGTAVVAQGTVPDRLRIFTARYMLTVRGKNRGGGKVEVEEVGDVPADLVHEIVRGVQERFGEAEPPVEIPPSLWVGEDDDEPAAEG